MRESLRRLFRASNPPAGPMKAPVLVGLSRHDMPRDSIGRRLRIMMRSAWLVGVAAVLLLAGIGAVSFYFATQPIQLKIAVGPPGSEDERVVEEIALQLREDRPAFRGIRLSLLRKENTTETAKALEKGDADLAVVRRDINMPKDGQVVAILRKNVVALWALPPEPKPEPKTEEKPAPKPAAKTAKARRAAAAKAAAEKAAASKAASAKKSGSKKSDDDDDDEAKDDKKAPRIQKVEQLIGKRVGIIGRSQANIELFRVIVAQYGIPSELITVLSTDEEKKTNAPGKISVVQLPVDKVAATLRDLKVDAVMSVGPLSSPVTAAAIAASRRDKEAPNFFDIKGDRVFVTGTIGDAVLGLKLRTGEGKRWALGASERKHLASRYLVPQPRNGIAKSVLAYATASMDVSDGLAGDLAKLCRASKVGAQIDVARVPLSKAARSVLARNGRLIEAMLSGGDDYEVLCTVPPREAAAFQAAARMAGVRVTAIGRIVKGEGAHFLRADGKPLSFKRASFSHF